MRKKFIEEEFPITEISEFGVNEKNNNFGNISTIHQWWARRPTLVCRALILASLFDYPDDQNKRRAISKYIINACKDFKSIPKQVSFKEKLKVITKKDDEPKKLLDPFSGGGAIPLEAARLGLESYGSDLNPIAVLISKATCEYFQKFNGDLFLELKKLRKTLNKEFIKEISDYYHNPLNDHKIFSFIWVKQIKCINSDCNALIPLLSNCLIASKKVVKNKKEKIKNIALKPVISGQKGRKKIDFLIQRDDEVDFDPLELKIFSRGKVTCPSCDITLKDNEVKVKIKEKNFPDRLLVIVEIDESSNKLYRIATIEDKKIFQKSTEKLMSFINLIPKEKIPEKVSLWTIQLYGISEWKEFFNDRQLLTAIIYINLLEKLFKKNMGKYENNEFKKALKLYLAFYLSKLLNYNSKLAYWDKRENIAKTWARNGLIMRGIYPENNPISNTSAIMKNYYYYLDLAYENISEIKNPAFIKQADAADLNFDSEFFDLIITDPPYYDAMGYANQSDFFYIWLRKCLMNEFPELFLLSKTPKDNEIIQNRYVHNDDNNKAKNFYESSMTKVLKNFYRILKTNGIGVIMYTHKSVNAWEALINSLIESNLTISSAWPIKTEIRGGLRTLNKVALASSIAIVFKKQSKLKEIFFETQFTNILENELRKKLKKLLLELEIYGADFFISAIGFSLNIFTKYEKIISQKTGEQVPASDFLDLVRKIVNDFLLSTVLEKNVTKTIDDISNLYIIWCWFFRNNGIDLDDALKLAQSFGVGELNDLRKKKLIKLEKKKFKLLLASDKIREDFLIKNREKLENLIDKLHLLAILWKNNDRTLDEEVIKTEAIFNENIWKVGQALAEFFPSNHKEHNYLQGLLARFGKTKTKTDLKKWL